VKTKSLRINILPYDPRVEFVQTWLVAVWLMGLESVALSESGHGY
jgi:hypothetical protein